MGGVVVGMGRSSSDRSSVAKVGATAASDSDKESLPFAVVPSTIAFSAA